MANKNDNISLKKIVNASEVFMNPLRGMTQNMIEQMFFNAR
jgi:hypothetical protein